MTELVEHRDPDLIAELAWAEVERHVRLEKDDNPIGCNAEVVDAAFVKCDTFVDSEQALTRWVLLSGGTPLNDDEDVVHLVLHPLRECAEHGLHFGFEVIDAHLDQTSVCFANEPDGGREQGNGQRDDQIRPGHHGVGEHTLEEQDSKQDRHDLQEIHLEVGHV